MSLVDYTTYFLDVSTVSVFLLCLIVSYIYVEWKRAAKLPPGPTGIPVLGYAPFIDKSVPFWRLSRDLAKRYNSDITSMNVLGTTAVFLTSREATKEAFQKRHDMTDRPVKNFFKALDPTHEGLILSSGPLWQEQRRFSLLMLRDFGMGKIAAEQNIQDEAIVLCEQMKSHGAEDFDPIKILEPAVSNIICAIGFGKRFSYDDPKFNAALHALNFLLTTFTSSYGRIVLSKHLSWLAPLLYPSVKRTSLEKYDLLCEFIQSIIDEHTEAFDGNVNDLIDGYLLEKSKRTGTQHSFSDRQLRHLIFDLFLAGSETTTTTLRWALLYLIKFPDVQKRIYTEISSVIGPERVPNMSDRKSTPYTEAFLLEVQRYNTLVTLSVCHACSEDIQFMGYTIPADSVIFSNLSAIHRDPKMFDDPDTFRPERFLDGDKVVDADKVDQFGIGRRICVGESLARMEIYIFFTAMVQRLQFTSVENQEIDLDSGMDGTVLLPQPFRLRAVSRHTTNVQ